MDVNFDPDTSPLFQGLGPAEKGPGVRLREGLPEGAKRIHGVLFTKEPACFDLVCGCGRALRVVLEHTREGSVMHFYEGDHREA